MPEQKAAISADCVRKLRDICERLRSVLTGLHSATPLGPDRVAQLVAAADLVRGKQTQPKQPEFSFFSADLFSVRPAESARTDSLLQCVEAYVAATSAELSAYENAQGNDIAVCDHMKTLFALRALFGLPSEDSRLLRFKIALQQSRKSVPMLETLQTNANLPAVVPVYCTQNGLGSPRKSDKTSTPTLCASTSTPLVTSRSDSSSGERRASKGILLSSKGKNSFISPALQRKKAFHNMPSPRASSLSIPSDNIWISASEAFQNILGSQTLEGNAYMTVITGDTKTEIGRVFLTNRDVASVFRYLVGMQPKGDIDLTHATNIQYEPVRIPPKVDGVALFKTDSEHRSCEISISVDTSKYILTFATSSEAAFWMMGLRSIALGPDPEDNSDVMSASEIANVLFITSGEGGTENESHLRLDYKYLQKKLADAEDDIKKTEHQIRDFTLTLKRMQNDFFILHRRKNMLECQKEEILRCIESVEMELAAKEKVNTVRGRRSNKKIGRSVKDIFSSLKIGRRQEKSEPINASKVFAEEDVGDSFSNLHANTGPKTELAISNRQEIVRWMSTPNYKPLNALMVQPGGNPRNVVFAMRGPADSAKGPCGFSFGSFAAGKIVTGYPLNENSVKKVGDAVPRGHYYHDAEAHHQGDPICDQFSMKVVGNRAIAALADGCGWGSAPRDAARCACGAFVDFVAKHSEKIMDASQAGDIVVMGVASAAEKVCMPADPVNRGFTTMVGGVLLRNSESHARSYGQYIFAGVSIGDCKAFHYSAQNRFITDVTTDNRMNITDPTDPGGRLGPYVDGNLPDLRNMQVFSVLCEENDLIFLVSDGVHDNFDPEHDAIPPKDTDPTIPFEDWTAASTEMYEQAARAKEQYCQNKMREVLRKHMGGAYEERAPVPTDVTEALVAYSLEHTIPSREFIESYPRKRLPNDYARFPGKVDHVSCLCLRVTNNFADVEAAGQQAKSEATDGNVEILFNHRGF